MTIDDLMVMPNEGDNRDIVSQCSVCKHFVSNTGEYILLSPNQSQEVYKQYLVSHGYCEPCYNYMLEKEGLL